MDLVFCQICGEHHRLGFCPEAGPTPDPALAKAPVRTAAPIPSPPAQPSAPPIPSRPFTPDDMKQESMPVIKPRFDRNAYQRELMRKRRAIGRGNPDQV
jgi:hypothetical protein